MRIETKRGQPALLAGIADPAETFSVTAVQKLQEVQGYGRSAFGLHGDHVRHVFLRAVR